MPDNHDNTAPGRTRWSRFFLALGVGLAAAGVLIFGMAQGSLAASLTVSGGSFQVSADKVRGTGFVQYGQVDTTADGKQPVAVNGFRMARLDNFCQSFLIDDLAGVGSMSVKLSAPNVRGMEAENMIVDLSQLNADLKLVEPEIGVDAAELDGPPGGTGAAGTFGLQAQGIELEQLRQTTWSTTAATLRFREMSLSAKPGYGNQCF